MTYVYVVDKVGKPLMPTKRCGYVKHLLKEGKAMVINNNPFTIQLTYESTHYTQPLTLGIDTGRENIGLGVSNEKGECVYLANVITKNKNIKTNMQKRKEHRNARRRHRRIRKQRKAIKNKVAMQKGSEDILRTKKPCKSKEISYPRMEKSITHKVIKGKEAKFANRKRKEGWLTPSARSLVQVHIKCVKRVQEILPITNICIERVSFDFQKLENTNIENWQYSKGPLYGFASYKDYIFQYQRGKCLLCEEDKIEHYHHIVYKSKNGSNTVKNYVGLCETCHTLVHNNPSYEEELLSLKEGLKTKYSISLLNSCMDVIIDEYNHILPTIATNGYETSKLRNTLGLEKTHAMDGYVISLCGKNTNDINICEFPQTYTLMHFKRKSGGNLLKNNQREYYIDGNSKPIAINRHKSFNQKEDSLEEYMNAYAQTHTKEECDRYLRELKVKPAKRTYTYHKYGIVSPFQKGDKVLYQKHNKVKGNTKQFVFVVTNVKVSQGVLCHNNDKQNHLMKFCKKLSSNSLEYI